MKNMEVNYLELFLIQFSLDVIIIYLRRCMIVILFLILPIGYFFSCHKITLKRGGSYMKSPRWLQNKIAAIKPQNKYGECFKYAATFDLHQKDIPNNPQKITNIPPFIATPLRLRKCCQHKLREIYRNTVKIPNF